MNDLSIDQTAREYSICLQGASLDTGNQGCSALATSLVQLAMRSKPNGRIKLLYNSRIGGVRNLRASGRTVKVNVVNCRLSPKSQINEHLFWILLLALIQRIILIKPIRDKIIRSNRWLKALENADFVGEICGGDSFSDLYGLHQFLVGAARCIIAILVRKEIVLLPQTYGPFNSALTKRMARFIMMRAAQLYSRDKKSMEVVQELLGEKGKCKTVRFCPDVAFILESVLPKQLAVQPKLDPNISVPLIGLNISGLLYLSELTHNNKFGLRFDYKEFLPLLLQRLMEQTNAHVLLVPHVGQLGTEVGEPSVSREVLKSVDQQYSTRLHLVTRQYDQSEVKGVIGLCDFFIGSRMHACIAALSQGIPTVGLAYSRKFYGVFETVGAEQFVGDMRYRSREEIIDIIRNAFEHRKTIKEKLQPRILEVKERVIEVFKEMLS